MALTEVQQPGVQLRRADAVGESDTVRHVDQLSERALDLLLAAVGGGSAGSLADVFEPGEVIVFDEYYRVEQA